MVVAGDGDAVGEHGDNGEGIDVGEDGEGGEGDRRGESGEGVEGGEGGEGNEGGEGSEGVVSMMEIGLLVRVLLLTRLVTLLEVKVGDRRKDQPKFWKERSLYSWGTSLTHFAT